MGKKYYIKNGFTVLKSYLISLLVFCMCFYVVLVLTNEENLSKWLVIYSVFYFIPTCLLIYKDMKLLAAKEKRHAQEMKPYKLKGLVYGSIAIVPFIVLQIVYLILQGENEAMNRLYLIILKVVMGPFHCIIELTGDTWISFIVADLVLPVTAMIGYIAGYYGFYLMKHIFNNGDKKTNLINKYKTNQNN